MTVNELMQMSADKAAAELTPESLEFLFQSRIYIELFLRMDFDGTQKKLLEQFPAVVPVDVQRAINVETFYRLIQNELRTVREAS